ncbi:Myc-type [Macleaya cordata]|uniref:Myc-type n=1 Tax=Macleaya cordata TaxID=56857 RepID=A0A200PUC3_MACCD|nr:Myc-type [Macleaya cordata]
MGKDSGSWVHQQHSPWKSPYWNCTPLVPDLRQQNIHPGYTYPYNCMVSANGSFPGFAFSGLPYLKTGQANELNGWFYCLPRHRQAFTTPNVVPKEKLTGDSLPNSVSGSVQNGFFVFDHSRNATSLFLGSVNGSAVQNLIPENRKPFDTSSGPCGEEWATKKDQTYQSGHVISDGWDENQDKTGDEESEMHEDTEELDALLYSDGDSDFDDDEEVSTGHYPGEFTEYNTKKHVEVEGSEEEEVASSIGTSKRKRKLDEKWALMDTASSVKPNVSRELDDDAESSCVKCRRTQVVENDSLPSNKRLKRDKIREAVSILQSIIPGGGKGKDAMFVLDEAIRYLRSMKAQS